MTTKPTPLTAEEQLISILNDFGCLEFDNERDQSLIKRIKAFFAQQNAELVAENKRLNESNAQLIEAGRFEAFEGRKNHLKLIKLMADNTELQAENERLKQQLAWQPISTAPKDGTIILGYLSDIKTSMTMWRLKEGFGVPDGGVWDGISWYGPKPTHWMPLPQPPKEAT